jgi:hypothetical protein
MNAGPKVLSGSARLALLATGMLAVAVLGGLLGWFNGEVFRIAKLHHSGGMAAFAFNLAISAAAPVLFTFNAAQFIRASAGRRWLAPASLLFPVLSTHYAAAHHPLLIFLAEASWFAALLLCGDEQRRLKFWAVLSCGAFTTAVQLMSALVIDRS